MVPPDVVLTLERAGEAAGKADVCPHATIEVLQLLCAAPNLL